MPEAVKPPKSSVAEVVKTGPPAGGRVAPLNAHTEGVLEVKLTGA